MIVYIVQGRDTVLYSTVVTYYSVVRTALCVYCTCWIRWGNVTGDRSTAVLISHPESFLKRQEAIVDRVWSWVRYAWVCINEFTSSSNLIPQCGTVHQIPLAISKMWTTWLYYFKSKTLCLSFWKANVRQN